MRVFVCMYIYIPENLCKFVAGGVRNDCYVVRLLMKIG